ncbi:MAG TPA: TetR family transcriptional regulator [Propionibacterium sp.]|nr:TetR family transcriptional regulator [Propionibacterium sp.]
MTPVRRPHVPLEERRRELTQTALRVMARDGAWALTTRAVAKEAGVPHGSVHYAFSSKNELLRAVMGLDLGHLTDLAVALLERPITGVADVRDALATLFADYADAVIAEPGLEAVQLELSMMGVRDAALGEIAKAMHLEYRRLMVDMITVIGDRCGLGWDSDAAVIAEATMAQLYGASLNWLGHRDDALFRAVLDDLARQVAARLG